MKFKGFALFVLVAIMFWVAAYHPNTDNAQKEAILMQTIRAGLDQLHYQPQELNDNFSNQLYDLYLEQLDRSKRWLTREDIEQLAAYKDLLDDEAKEGTYQFLDLSQALFLKSLKKTKKYYQEILANPFDFTGNEILEMDGEKKDFAKNDKELKERWVKMMKYETLSRLVDKLEEQEKKEEKEEREDTEAKKAQVKTVAQLEEEARKSVLKLFDDWYHRMEKRQRKDYLSDYLNAFTGVYDPHTNYFLPADKANFDIGMSGRLEGIGARLQETTTDETKVVHVVPGGPAYRGKVLEVNDIIQKVAQGDDGEWIDVAGWDINDVVAKIRGKKGTKVRLSLKKVDGTIVETTIVRDEIVMDDGYAKSSILNLPGTIDNIGYIKLPRFYADFNKRDGRQCAKDVEAELEKLKGQNVNGVILDLRSNGGGSLRDVVKMSGFFIEEGPIVQVKSRIANAEVLRDKDEKVQYDGPLIVMVNSFSASASEILAAALQDYGRAVIVGSDATFGKGTVQRFFDLDRAIRGHSDIKPLGEVKLTVQKFYRVNGGSTQLKGVRPDIILPDNYNYIETGEEEYETAMKWTEIDPIAHGQAVYQIKDLNALRAASKNRVKTDATFRQVEENAKRLKAKRDKTTYSLNLEKYRANRKRQADEAKKYSNLFKTDIEGLEVSNLEMDLDYIQADSSRIGRNEDFLNSLKKDVYVEESLHIMKDMIQQSSGHDLTKNVGKRN